MDRVEWLKELRRLAKERYDSLYAPTYDAHWGTIYPTHERCLNRFLSLCPAQALIVDAACGTGKYWPVILASGRSIFGLDQSQEMLARARAKHPGVPCETVGLQEMHYRDAFDGGICMDAMEFVSPEDWPRVLGNFYHAIRPGSYFYFTVEAADRQEIERDYAAGQQQGLPLVYGESVHEGGYHYYPQVGQVTEWVRLAGFYMMEEVFGDEYHHFLVQRR